MQDSCLDELLRHDGPSILPSVCAFCPAGGELYQCKDCVHGRRLLCSSCIVSKHSELELHHVEVSELFVVLKFFLIIH